MGRASAPWDLHLCLSETLPWQGNSSLLGLALASTLQPPSHLTELSTKAVGAAQQTDTGMCRKSRLYRLDQEHPMVRQAAFHFNKSSQGERGELRGPQRQWSAENVHVLRGHWLWWEQGCVAPAEGRPFPSTPQDEELSLGRALQRPPGESCISPTATCSPGSAPHRSAPAACLARRDPPPQRRARQTQARPRAGRRSAAAWRQKGRGWPRLPRAPARGGPRHSRPRPRPAERPRR